MEAEVDRRTSTLIAVLLVLVTFLFGIRVGRISEGKTPHLPPVQAVVSRDFHRESFRNYTVELEYAKDIAAEMHARLLSDHSWPTDIQVTVVLPDCFGRRKCAEGPWRFQIRSQQRIDSLVVDVALGPGVISLRPVHAVRPQDCSGNASLAVARIIPLAAFGPGCLALNGGPVVRVLTGTSVIVAGRVPEEAIFVLGLGDAEWLRDWMAANPVTELALFLDGYVVGTVRADDYNLGHAITNVTSLSMKTSMIGGIETAVDAAANGARAVQGGPVTP
jgi:hypothetical protein